MNPVSQGSLISDQILSWSHYEPSLRFLAGFCAVRTPEGVLLIDPLPMDQEALCQLERFGVPKAILITNANHERASLEMQQKWGIPRLASERASLQLKADQSLNDGQTLFGTLRILQLPGAGIGEIAVIQTGSFCIFGDFLIHLTPGRLKLLPEKYCENPVLARASLPRLRGLEVPWLLFAHGSPLHDQGSRQLQKFLEEEIPQ